MPANVKYGRNKGKKAVEFGPVRLSTPYGHVMLPNAVELYRWNRYGWPSEAELKKMAAKCPPLVLEAEDDEEAA